MTILRNISLKLLALFFAILLWIHVATNQRYDLEVQYRLAYVNVPDSLVFTETPTTTIEVFMRGSGKGLIRLLWSERRWPIDMTRSKAGVHKIHLSAENIPVYGIQGLEALGLLDSDTVTVVLDSIGHHTMPAHSSGDVHTGAESAMSSTLLRSHGSITVDVAPAVAFVNRTNPRPRATLLPPLQGLKVNPDSVTVVCYERARADTGG